MSGILDNKSRVIDAILTYEGRRQMADGNFIVRYVTFSDSNVFYQKSATEGHEDPTNKIYLEAFNLPQDQIIFEADDSGNLMPFRQHESIGVQTLTGSITSSLSWTTFYQGKLKQTTKYYATSTTVTSSFTESAIKDINFSSQIEGILTSSYDNFRKLKIIGSKDNFFNDQEFALSNNEITFNIAPDNINLQMSIPTDVNSIDALFNDEKLRNIDNFKYLPPIKKTNNQDIDKTNIAQLENFNLFLGDYPAWGPINKLQYSDIKKQLTQYEQHAKTIYLDPTSRDNEVVAQMFEITPSSVSKLDVIDYGRVSNNFNNPFLNTHHIFFLGKVLIDDVGSTNFVHIFTLVFEIDEESNDISF